MSCEHGTQSFLIILIENCVWQLVVGDLFGIWIYIYNI